LVSSETALQLRGVRASYGAREVLGGLDLKVDRGEVLALLGHNGAGKTTTLRVAVGLKRPLAGTVWLLGRDIARLRCSARARAGLALVPEGVSGIFPTLTVRQNLAAARPALNSRAAEDVGVKTKLEAAFGEVLVDRADQVAGSMSGGQRQMLAISLALIRRPSVLLLDEPSTGLAPSVVQRIFSAVADLTRQTGAAVVIVEQDVAAALKIATRILIMQSGNVVAEYSRETCPPATELWRFF
jgi:ABC-type branched-subunit amino acid transport system ATPase component